MTSDDDPNGDNYGNGFTGLSNGWIQEKMDLTPYAGQQIQIRFEYLTDDGPVYTGFFLDDIEIPQLDYREDAEIEQRWLGVTRLHPQYDGNPPGVAGAVNITTPGQDDCGTNSTQPRQHRTLGD